MTLLGAKGIATRSKVLGAPGLTTKEQEATSIYSTQFLPLSCLPRLASLASLATRRRGGQGRLRRHGDFRHRFQCVPHGEASQASNSAGHGHIVAMVGDVRPVGVGVISNQ